MTPYTFGKRIFSDRELSVGNFKHDNINTFPYNMKKFLVEMLLDIIVDAGLALEVLSEEALILQKNLERGNTLGGSFCTQG